MEGRSLVPRCQAFSKAGIWKPDTKLESERGREWPARSRLTPGTIAKPGGTLRRRGRYQRRARVSSGVRRVLKEREAGRGRQAGRGDHCRRWAPLGCSYRGDPEGRRESGPAIGPFGRERNNRDIRATLLHNSGRRPHSQEEFALTPKKRPGPLIRFSRIQSSRGGQGSWPKNAFERMERLVTPSRVRQSGP